MTRINAGVPPSALCDQHLIAEYRELPRVRSLALKYAQHPLHVLHSRQPNKFKLGTGHVLFFVDKGAYLQQRWSLICNEMRSRGFNVSLTWRDWPKTLNGEWNPTPHDAMNAGLLSLTRINARLEEMKRGGNAPRYTGNSTVTK